VDKIKPVYIVYRKPSLARFSLESYFSRLQVELARLGVPSISWCAPCESKGILNRVRIGISLFASSSRHLTHVTGDILFSSLFVRGKLVVTFPDCEILSRLSGPKRFLVKWLWYILPAWRASAITAISYETKQRLLETVPFIDPEKISVIYVSISDLFLTKKKRFNRLRPRILQVGTKRNKNLGNLIEAISGLQCELTIIGKIEKSDQNMLKEHKISYRSVSQLTEEQVLQEYVDCDILAFVSLEEGFGMPIVEAQMVGRVVVASNCSCVPEIAGLGACYVDPKDVTDIRRGIEQVINNDDYRNELIEAGLKNAQRFEIKRIARQYVDLYHFLTHKEGSL
jgi:glycosyltransferase involved in cell wall biosynthesis